MSLKEMDNNNPENGSLSHVGMYCGQYDVDTPIKNQTTFTTIDPNAVGSYDGTTIGSNSGGYLSTDRKDAAWQSGMENNVDKGTNWYSQANAYLPSPYMVVNGKEVLCPQYNSGALSDFDGKGNTAILTKLHTVQNWKTADKITNGSGSTYTPAAVCCARYKTEGTNSGDWYLPAIGELGFIAPRFNEIQNSLLVLGKNKAIPLHTNYHYWSSTEYSKRFKLGFYTYFGMVFNYVKDRQNYVRAFRIV